MDTWMRVCRFFNHDPDKRHAERIVQVPGMLRRLLPVQAHGVWFALYRLYSVHRSLFLGYIMGLGKTTMAICLHLVQYIINEMRYDMAVNPDDHSPDGYAPCPSAARLREKYKLECPCRRDSSTYGVESLLGGTVVMVPIRLIKNWNDEYWHCFNDNSGGKVKTYKSTFRWDSEGHAPPGQVGLIIRDEGHEECGESSATMKAIRAVRKANESMDVDPPRLEMAWEGWKDHDILSKWCNGEAIDLGKRFAVASKTGQDADNIVKEIREDFGLLHVELTVAFSLDSHFLDKGKVLDLNPNVFINVE
ncbi:hypothetical protein ACMFMF_004761 [Clarireedia jacksonii]